MASPAKRQPEAVADKVLKRAEVGKVSTPHHQRVPLSEPIVAIPFLPCLIEAASLTAPVL